MIRVDKPWGYEIIWAHTEYYAGKILHINKGHSLSLQYHNQKTESIYIYSGKITLELDGKELTMDVGNSILIPSKATHRMTALEDTDVFEVSTPELQDIVRLKDNYGRLTPSEEVK